MVPASCDVTGLPTVVGELGTAGGAGGLGGYFRLVTPHRSSAGVASQQSLHASSGGLLFSCWLETPCAPRSSPARARELRGKPERRREILGCVVEPADTGGKWMRAHRTQTQHWYTLANILPDVL